MTYEKKPPEWGNPGAEPPAELKVKGFTAGYKPPAAYFNWFWSQSGSCMKELQEKTTETDNSLTVLSAQVKSDIKGLKDKAAEADTHIKSGVAGETGVHGFRFYTDSLQYKDASGSWITISKKGEFPTKAEAQGYVNAHNTDPKAHEQLLKGMISAGSAAGGDLTGTYPNPSIKVSVALTGAPTAPTPAAADNSTKIATTAFVQGIVGDINSILDNINGEVI